MSRGIDVVNYCVRGEVSTYDYVWGGNGDGIIKFLGGSLLFIKSRG